MKIMTITEKKVKYIKKLLNQIRIDSYNDPNDEDGISPTELGDLTSKYIESINRVLDNIGDDDYDVEL
jgi:hypothetical protein